MILHVCGPSRTFSRFIPFIEENFDFSKHFFWRTIDNKRGPFRQGKNINNVALTWRGKLSGYCKLVFLMQRSDKIVFHGLFNQWIILLLFLMPWLHARCYWVIWGGDLYQYNTDNRNLKWKTKQLLLRSVLRRLGHLVTYIEGDVKLAREWYGATGKHHECLMYPSNLYKPLDVTQDKHSGLNIQIGHSANASNYHVEIMEALLPHKEEDIRIYAPLTYGDEQYAEYIISKGKEWFGDKFQPITKHMPLDEYVAFLGTIDIALFNHRRQQGMGNTITLLGLGKTVYIRSDVTQWSILRELGVAIMDVTKLSLNELDSKCRSRNIDVIKAYFSKKNLYQQLNTLFE